MKRNYSKHEVCPVTCILRISFIINRHGFHKRFQQEANWFLHAAKILWMEFLINLSKTLFSTCRWSNQVGKSSLHQSIYLVPNPWWNPCQLIYFWLLLMVCDTYFSDTFPSLGSNITLIDLNWQDVLQKLAVLHTNMDISIIFGFLNYGHEV